MKTWVCGSRAAVLCLLLAASLGGCDRESRKVQDPKERLRAGWLNYQLGEYTAAVSAFEDVIASADGDENLSLQGLYGLATTWNLRRPDENPELAGQLYRKLIERAPKHDLAAWSLLALARMKHVVTGEKNPDYDEVRKAYQEVIDRFPGHLAADEAFLYQQSTVVANLKEDDVRKALAALREFVRTRPDSKFISPIYSLIGDCHATLKEPEEALAAMLKSFEAMEIDPTNPYVEKAWNYWTIAVYAEFEAGDFAVARKFYGMLIREYPKDVHIYAAKQALRRMDEMEAKIRGEAKPDAGAKGGGG